ncbi:MAG: MarR family transcriptional regulator [Actinomycetota bacterium]|nr:MarR family transcriptional regulator [Actinomycetota bacterium]
MSKAGAEGARLTARRTKIQAVKSRLRELRSELSVLNHRVGSRVQLRDVDLDCLEVVVREGPLSPSALARRTGVHLATMTGVLNRLESEGWVRRERAEHDRRAVLVRSVPDRVREIFGHYDGMNAALDAILERYTETELEVIIDFLERCAEAGSRATKDLAE